MEHLRAHNHMAEMTDIRCKKCNALLGKISTPKAQIEIKCHKCKYLNLFWTKQIKQENAELEYASGMGDAIHRIVYNLEDHED